MTKETEKQSLNYDVLLNDWAESLFAEAEKHKQKMSTAEIGSYEYGYHKGCYDATYMAITKLNVLEGRKNKRYRMECDKS